ncbi:NAD(P)/FAD-dependent oxidoreductase [Aestuariirhabdus sp. Z084]|uniref:NAD(P)/FAD-dependent oxidoreductase n=1 Tax=Aestuariirhabdus haliotis TaxID=2918751 RepID=UPI00201B36A7|nr:NAD(P)/FAD-dependent oxidoreductase [Aestuariirhabdus haliotis]MCL6416440.1 NAD(P)/FAD-dependent oxidoreductase [Aestuariirhabdus haliotis]MCL6420393.1 NAD(P)/FAD-dependent oxidoreductase [Aestuariirhabdus haliotis]
MQHIVVVGGGAGGLELVTRLGRALGHRKGKQARARVTLIDRHHTHLWKPLLHEVAAGTLDSGIDEVSYSAHGYKHGFDFKLGRVCDLNRQTKTLQLSPLYDEQSQQLILPAREVQYDILVMAVGSVSNDFGIPGIADHCVFLDSPQQAQGFHRQFLAKALQLDSRLQTHDRAAETPADRIDVAIVGGGATGVELSAELINALELLNVYGHRCLKPEHLRIRLIEAGPRLLPALSPRISSAVKTTLEQLGVEVLLDTPVVRADANQLVRKEGEPVRADLMVWAAGVKAPEFLSQLDGLENERGNQLKVKATLQTTLDDSVYALGDCAAFALGDGRFVPPRAQSAHQMATVVYGNILRQLEGKALKAFKYQDRGSLVSISRFSAVGTLMGNLTRGSLFVEGRMARLMYLSLYRLHQLALHGWFRTALLSLSGRINRALRPRLKLH